MRERTTLSMVARFSRMAALVGGMALLVLLASCVLNNTSSGTRSNGPVVISTDHSSYATNERMYVTVTNHLPMDIYAFDHGASCSILGLERQVNGQWQSAYSQAGCPLKRPDMQVRIAAGHSYTATIQAGEPGWGPVYYQATFSPGLYRLVLGYSTVAPKSPAAFVQSSTVSSATLTQSLWFTPVGIWAFLLGSGLTVLVLGGHLVVAAQQRSWSWGLLLLVGPLFCFGCYVLCYAVGFGPGIAARWLFIPGIGLPNLLFAFSIMQPRREAAPASLEAPDLQTERWEARAR